MTARDRVRSFLRESYPNAYTDGEIQAALNMKGDTERPRRLELEQAGEIEQGRSRVVEGHTTLTWRYRPRPA